MLECYGNVNVCACCEQQLFCGHRKCVWGLLWRQLEKDDPHVCFITTPNSLCFVLIIAHCITANLATASRGVCERERCS